MKRRSLLLAAGLLGCLGLVALMAGRLLAPWDEVKARPLARLLQP